MPTTTAPTPLPIRFDDGHTGTATGTVNVTVTAVNDPPVANDDAATVAEDSSNNTIDVLANDTDTDGDTLSIGTVSDPPHGTALIQGGVVKYAPDANYNGSDSFTYTVNDGHGGQRYRHRERDCDRCQ